MKETQKESDKRGLSKKIDDLSEFIHYGGKKKKKSKEFKLPFTIRARQRALAKKNRLLVILLRTNRSIELKTTKIIDGLIQFDGKFYQATTDFVYLYRGRIPSIVLPEWSLIPVGTKDYYDASKAGAIADPQKVIIKAIQAAEPQATKGLAGKSLIWIVIIGVAVFYFIFSSGGK